MKLAEIFIPKTSYSKGFKNHNIGKVPFVSNGFYNNGVVGFVTPLSKEKIINERSICVSAFCEATVQNAPYLPRGNGGSGMVVLIPKDKNMSVDKLFYYASQINLQSWRFSYGRMVTVSRLKKLDVEEYKSTNYKFDNYKKKLIPSENQRNNIKLEPLKEVSLGTLFKIVRGQGKYYANYSPGNVPLVSARNFDNGVIGFVDAKPVFKAPAITVERIKSKAFVQYQDFVTVPDDIFVLSPLVDCEKEFLIYVAALINHMSWRYSYSRKVTPTRLSKTLISLPFENEHDINFSKIKTLVENCLGSNLLN